MFEYSIKFVQKFQGSYLFKHHIATITGFVFGVKIIDYFFYNELPFEQYREQIEEEFWAKHGEPTEIEPEMLKSFKNEEIIRKTWIYIKYEKDKVVKKVNQIE